MEDGEVDEPDDDVDEAPPDPPNELERVGEETASPTFRPTIESSGWEINWAGAGTLAVVVIAVAIAWGWLGGDSGDTIATDDETPAVTTAPTSTIARTTTTTTAPVTTTTIPPTTTIAGPRVIISGEVKPCQFGDRCLTASFVIEGFDPHPGRFACIYPNSVSDFGFNDDDVVDACLTGDAGDTITIEVAGVRSATISEDDLDGTG